MKDFIFQQDMEIKAKDSLIIKMQWSKGEIKDEVFGKEKHIDDLNLRIKELLHKIDQLKEEVI